MNDEPQFLLHLSPAGREPAPDLIWGRLALQARVG